ncbi:hypothetical protein N7468_007335 [Penicillium chermesinum]|uniref:Uncharacterized protein n=1 Tax=Penicillium chermesinum TaxID=63820 RepID=A0A9W9NTY4_9EURO|nr:uncharacterized protein N7468_007335 [Penicillium chermesinum]KAJ5226110.1 hypothetical protein N7468_007335 [Penicillium chermesinum]
MWKNLISSGHQATKATSSLHAFSTIPFRQKEPEPGTRSDRESLSPQRSEATKSGTDSEVAEHPAAFDPKNTSPEGELNQTAKESQQQGKQKNPLNMSPANQEVNDWKAENGKSRNADRDASSSRGAPKKNRSIHVKEDGTHVSYRD